jgi:nitroreductase
LDVFKTLALKNLLYGAARYLYNLLITYYKMDVATINHIIKNRRSSFVKQFKPGGNIDNAIIEQLLQNANWAPNHKQTEPWRFTVFTGEGIKKLAAWQAQLYKETAGPGFKQDKYEKLLESPLLCTHIIAIGLKRHPVVPLVEDIAAVSMAVQNMYLTAAAYGIGCYWTTGGITYEPRAKTFFNLGDDDLLMGFLYIGELAVASPTGTRKPIADKVTWITQ